MFIMFSADLENYFLPTFLSYFKIMSSDVIIDVILHSFVNSWVEFLTNTRSNFVQLVTP